MFARGIMRQIGFKNREKGRRVNNVVIWCEWFKFKQKSPKNDNSVSGTHKNKREQETIQAKNDGKARIIAHIKIICITKNIQTRMADKTWETCN